MQITIPFKTPTINHLYGQHGFRKFLKPEAKELREKIQNICKDISIDHIKDKKLVVTTEIHEDWLTKKGEVKRKDIANREKFLIDSVFDELDIDDKLVYVHIMRKIQDTKEFAIIKIKEHNDK